MQFTRVETFIGRRSMLDMLVSFEKTSNLIDLNAFESGCLAGGRSFRDIVSLNVSKSTPLGLLK